MRNQRNWLMYGMAEWKEYAKIPTLGLIIPMEKKVHILLMVYIIISVMGLDGDF